MRAFIWTAYGPPEVLQLRQITTPEPKPGQVRVKIHANSVFGGDCELRRWDMLPMLWLPLRILSGIHRPKRIKILGQEFSGTVDAVGAQVSRFKVGDPVFGPADATFGGYAEYICVNADGPLTLKPEGLSHEQATTVPVGGSNALHFHRLAGLRESERILFVGAAGSIGTFSVQLAKRAGAHVTAVDSADKLDLLLSLGVDEVMDFRSQAWADHASSYDVIVNISAHCSFSKSAGLLADNGRLLLMNTYAADMLRGWWLSATSRRLVTTGLTRYRSKDLAELAAWVASGDITTVIDASYPFEKLPDAHRYVDSGRKAGHVVIQRVV